MKKRVKRVGLKPWCCVRLLAKKVRDFQWLLGAPAWHKLELGMPLRQGSYQTVPLLSIQPEDALPFSVFVYFKGHYLAFRKPGDAFGVSHYNRFIYKRIIKLYIAGSDFPLYKKYLEDREAKDALEFHSKDPVEIRSRRVARNLNLAASKVFTNELTSLAEDVAEVLDSVRGAVDFVIEQPYVRAFEETLNESDTVMNHAVRTSMMATYLCYKLGFVNPKVLQHVAAAGLLHDIGKSHISLEEDLNLGDNAEQEQERMMQHPQKAYDLLKKLPLVPEEVLQIILEHHEFYDGSGYPRGLARRKINGLSRVFSIANTFENIASSMQGSQEERYRMAAEVMQEQMAYKFDKSFLSRALRILVGGAAGK
jgi:putative nucleotidyltransferase with HDIG domain